MNWEIVFQLVLAVFLGALIGLERELKRKEAGLQTYSLVALGACLFTLIAFQLTNFFSQDFNPGPVIQAISIGIGFLGAGVILRQSLSIVGLTTAAGIWSTAAIGVAIGLRLYFLALISTILILFIFVILGWLEGKFIRKK